MNDKATCVNETASSTRSHEFTQLEYQKDNNQSGFGKGAPTSNKNFGCFDQNRKSTKHN